MKQLLFICCVAGVCWASENDQGYGSLPKSEESGFLAMEELRQCLSLSSIHSGIKREKDKFYIFKNGVWNFISNDRVFCQSSDKPESYATVQKIENVVRGFNECYGKSFLLPEFNKKHSNILLLAASFCTKIGGSTYNEHFQYSEVNRWAEAHEEVTDEGKVVIYLRRHSKDSPRALTPCPVPESPQKKEEQFFASLDVDMNN